MSILSLILFARKISATFWRMYCEIHFTNRLAFIIDVNIQVKTKDNRHLGEVSKDKHMFSTHFNRYSKLCIAFVYMILVSTSYTFIWWLTSQISFAKAWMIRKARNKFRLLKANYYRLHIIIILKNLTMYSLNYSRFLISPQLQ